MSSDTSPSIVPDQTPPSAEATAIEAPKVELKAEPLTSEAAAPATDIKPDVESSIASVIKGRFAARPRARRYAVLAASIAIAAAIGSVVGALAGVALMRPEPENSIARTLTADALSQLSTDIASLKTALDTASKTTSTQLGKISERVERAEKAQAEAAQKTARLLETPKAPAPAPTDITGSIAEKQPARPPIVEGWVIRDIFDGRAMVESSRHGIFEVGPGAPLPGVGRVEAVRRQDGRWVVVTPKGLIVSAR